MSMETVLNYLTLLEQNNNQEWFHEHKTAYQEANREFELTVEELMMELHKEDSTVPLLPPKTLTFKLQRDTRFSHDKSPYNPSFRAHIGPQGKLPVPVGYYLMIGSGNRSFLGGGLFADMFKNATEMVRSYMTEHGNEWDNIIKAPEFTEHFAVGGTSLKKVPPGYDVNHPQAEYLKYKSWYLEFPVTDEQVVDGNFVSYAAEIFKKMKPFNEYLNCALKDFRMPVR